MLKAENFLLKNGDVLFARSGETVGKTFQFKNYQGIACYAGYTFGGFNPASGANDCNVTIKGNADIEFTYNDLEIIDWNFVHLVKPPVGDCNMIPCSGILEKCE